MHARSGMAPRGITLALSGHCEPDRPPHRFAPTDAMTEVPGVLIVEDDRASLDGLVALMAGAGYRVTGAPSFEEGRRALAALPDVLVTDVRLGAYNGLQLIIRGRALNPRLHAIVVTGHSDVVVRREAERLDAIHLEKPVNPARLLDEVAHALMRSAPKR
jgi:DNA-binding NtrC family response regulator